MIINPRHKPWLICSTNANRLSITGAFLDKIRGALVATDGKRLATFPVTHYEEDDEAIIPVEALRAAAKAGRKIPSLAQLKIKDGLVTLLADGSTWPTVKMQFPDWAPIMPINGFAAAYGVEGRRVARIMLDPALLAGLHEALKTTSMNPGTTLEFMIDEAGDCVGKPIIVSVDGAHPAYLMPMRLDRQKDKKASDVKEQSGR